MKALGDFLTGGRRSSRTSSRRPAQSTPKAHGLLHAPLIAPPPPQVFADLLAAADRAMTVTGGAESVAILRALDQVGRCFRFRCFGFGGSLAG